MSTKPTDVGRFAVDGSDGDAANIIAPSSGRRDTGYTLDYVPPSAQANYLENVAYRWRQWLNDGDVAFKTISNPGDTVTFPDGIVVHSVGQFTQTINADGGLFLPNNQSVVSEGFNLWNVGSTSLNFKHESELDVDGKLACGDMLVSGDLTTDASGLLAFQQWAFDDFTFTADASTDSVASSGPSFPSARLRTGDGPLRVSNSGGSLPGGLSAGTDYYWIGDAHNVGQLATSRANALDGVVINISSNGTGTHTLLHQSNTTRVGNVTVGRDLAVNHNATVTGAFTTGVTAATNQHMVVSGTGKYKRGTRVRPIFLFSMQLSTHFWDTIFVNEMTNGDSANFGIPFEEGETLISVQARVRCGTAGALSMQIRRQDLTSTTPGNVQIGSTATSTGAVNNLETLTISGLSETAGSSFFYYWLDFTQNNAGPVILDGAWFTTTV